MKFVVFWEICSGTRDAIIAKGDAFHDEMKADPTKYGRYLRMQDGSAIGFVMIGTRKGFNLVEYDTEVQMAREAAFWAPEISMKFVPIRPIHHAQSVMEEHG